VTEFSRFVAWLEKVHNPPENEQRATIQLSPEEIRRLLQASLIEGAWAE